MKVSFNSLSRDDMKRNLKSYASIVQSKPSYDSIRESVFSRLSETHPMPALDGNSILTRTVVGIVNYEISDVDDNVITMEGYTDLLDFLSVGEDSNESDSSEGIDNEDDGYEEDLDEEDEEELDEDDDNYEEDFDEEDEEELDDEEEELYEDEYEEELDEEDDEDLEDEEEQEDNEQIGDDEDFGNDFSGDSEDETISEEEVSALFETPLDLSNETFSGFADMMNDDNVDDNEDESGTETLLNSSITSVPNSDVDISSVSNMENVISNQGVPTQGRRKVVPAFDSTSDSLSFDLLSNAKSSIETTVTQEESNSPKEEIRNESISREDLPKTPLEYLKKNRGALETKVKELYSPSDVDKYISRGLIQRLRGKLYI